MKRFMFLLFYVIALFGIILSNIVAAIFYGAADNSILEKIMNIPYLLFVVLALIPTVVLYGFVVLGEKRKEKQQTPKKKKSVNKKDRAYFDNEVDKKLKRAVKIIPKEKNKPLPSIKEYPSVRDWHSFESELWDIGESIRQIETREGKRFSPEQAARILDICHNTNAERGRESFVMLLARKCYASYSGQLVDLLCDHDVYGHVIYTLYRMDSGKYVEQIKPFLEDKVPWIRNEAKRYIKKYDK